MYKTENIFPVASTSHIEGRKQIAIWAKDIFLPNITADSLLIHDAWSTYNTSEIKQLVKDKGFKLQTIEIPAGQTPVLQPLDVFFFGPYKRIAKRISNFIILHDLDCNLFQRNNILKLQSLIHNQFSSPRYTEMIKYSWKSSGYPVTYAHFENPYQFAFPYPPLIWSCIISNCNQGSFIRCSWCKMIICFDHFFNYKNSTEQIVHYCKEYIP